MKAPPPLTGRLTYRQQSLPNQEISVLSASHDAFLSQIWTDEDGHFHYQPAEEGQSAVSLLVKVRQPFIGLAYHPVSLPSAAPLDIALHMNLFTLSGNIADFTGRVPHLQLFLDPLHLNGIPEQLSRFFFQTAPQVHRAHFYQATITEDSFAIAVQAGRYALGAAYLNMDRPNMVDPDFDNVQVDGIQLAGTASNLPGNPHRGFEVEVNSDMLLTLSWRVVPDDEL